MRAGGSSALSLELSARALVAAGHVESVQQAFDRYISDDHTAFVPTSLQDPAGAIALIEASGGVAVWAHPPRDLVQSLIKEVADAGLRGLEVYRPSHSAGYQLELEGLFGTIEYDEGYDPKRGRHR